MIAARAWFSRAAIGLILIVAAISLADAQKIPDVRNTKHNLSVTGPGPLKAQSETQVCVFCHTPHGAETLPGAPLWNRKQSGATYTPYSSSSLEANAAELASGPGGTSKLCLSCHDGTMAISNVNVLNGQGPATVALTGAGPGGTMPPSTGAGTGFTRHLGVNLTNDHPISFTYDAALATADGELRTPDGTNVGTRVAGVNPKPKLPLENGQMQCATCHDPHLRETDATKGSGKFLRGNRFQFSAPAGGTYAATDDIICLACHDKAGQAWAGSAHANPNVATQVYSPGAAALREFPTNLPVWQAACLNCHDTHTVQGARRLLREGTDSVTTPKSGGNSAIEQTCYQCHSSAAESILTSTATVPNIKSDFSLLRHMPIDLQPEVHDIGTGVGIRRGKDFLESQSLLGKGALQNRHAECTDCHNPHRVTKNRLFNGNSAVPDAAGTHNLGSNIASGVLRGTTGVEPIYGAAANFTTNPIAYDLKRGDGGVGAGTSSASAWVTREYQVCLKCHSDFAYDTPPTPGVSPGTTPAGTNGVNQYTNQAMEFRAPAAHKGEIGSSDSGASAAYGLNNHRSWHPVIDNTGRTNAIRRTAVASFRTPWGANVGVQTMYCSDCHGSSTAADSIVPAGGENGSPWGPHGSNNDFILKGEWSGTTGTNARDVGYTANALCFKCHTPSIYADRNGGGGTGFSDSGGTNLHALHVDKIGRLRCTWCHVAVPHGWKNKALLVNLNDVGPEVGLAAGTQVRNNTTATYTRGPYYLNAANKVRTFARSGNWQDTNCGSAGSPGNSLTGKDWMGSSEGCTNPP